jgi:hypothetical protein
MKNRNSGLLYRRILVRSSVLILVLVFWCPRLGRSGLAEMQHSPSSPHESKVLQVECGLVLGESLRKDVCYHLVGGAINHSDLFVSDSLTNEMHPYVDVFGARVVVVVGRKV